MTEQSPALEFLSAMRLRVGPGLPGLPDALGFYPDGRVALREAKNVTARDRLRPSQHTVARAARGLLGCQLDLAVVEWG